MDSVSFHPNAPLTMLPNALIASCSMPAGTLGAGLGAAVGAGAGGGVCCAAANPLPKAENRTAADTTTKRVLIQVQRYPILPRFHLVRLAATVMLIRPAEHAPFEVFMLRRSEASHFVPDVFVFPGGTLDA